MNNETSITDWRFQMNTSYNYSDFIGLSLESNDDYEPYGYDMERLQSVEVAQTSGADRSIESVMFAQNMDMNFYD
jgi:nitrate reductase beta subunit